MLELCRCPNIYGPDCISVYIVSLLYIDYIFYASASASLQNIYIQNMKNILKVIIT